LLVRPEVASAVRAPALLVGSAADPTWANGTHSGGDTVEVLEFERLDHSLQVERDPMASLDVLRQVTERVRNFLESID
jgi:hypothetical protein